MDYNPWGLKNRISSKKFMQVEVVVKFMQINFGGCSLFCFRDFANFLPSQWSMAKFSLQTIVYGLKIELAQKIVASRS